MRQQRVKRVHIPRITLIPMIFPCQAFYRHANADNVTTIFSWGMRIKPLILVTGLAVSRFKNHLI